MTKLHNTYTEKNNENVNLKRVGREWWKWENPQENMLNRSVFPILTGQSSPLHNQLSEISVGSCNFSTEWLHEF